MRKTSCANPPSVKDSKIEFELAFKSHFGKPKKVRLIFADMSGEISSALMQIFPELISSTPKEVREKLLDRGLGQEDVEYLVHTMLSARGVILVADSSRLGEPDTPDKDLAYYLDNLNQYARARGENPKGVALLLTKFDQFRMSGYENPSDSDLHALIRNYLPQVDNFASNFDRNQGTKYKIFCSVLNETKDKEDKLIFTVDKNNPRHQRRVVYSVQQYRRLIEWLRDTFGT